jgi:hypothetical protein
METHTGFFRTPRSIGVACACAATGLGLVYLAAASAPAAHLAVNVLSLVVGLAFYTLMQLSGMMARIGGGVAIALGGLLLLATALFGVPVEGASRWIRIGGLSLQVSLIVLPAMLVAFARGRDLLATIGVVLAAIALALQPDRAMAGVLVAGLGVLVPAGSARGVGAPTGCRRLHGHLVSARLAAGGAVRGSDPLQRIRGSSAGRNRRRGRLTPSPRSGDRRAQARSGEPRWLCCFWSHLAQHVSSGRNWKLSYAARRLWRKRDLRLCVQPLVHASHGTI